MLKIFKSSELDAQQREAIKNIINQLPVIEKTANTEIRYNADFPWHTVMQLSCMFGTRELRIYWNSCDVQNTLYIQCKKGCLDMEAQLISVKN